MKKISLMLVFVGFATLANAQKKVPWYESKDAAERGIYGPDTRAEAKTKWAYKDYMRATATAIRPKRIAGDKIYTYDLKTVIKQIFGDYPIDESVRFQDQPAAGFCSGFLIAPDILVTAGHCIKSKEDMENTVWVFDYTSDVYYNKSANYITIPESNQYKVVEILDTKLTNDASYDYCVVRLDRRTDRKPYKFRTGGELGFDDWIAMIGSPMGLPLKVADSAHVTNNEIPTYFLTDLDVFGGNSGGPVFNFNGFIEGILVRGPGRDYHYDATCGCIKTDVLMDLNYVLGRLFEEEIQAESGNAVHRITSIPWNLLVTGVYRNLELAIQDNNLEEFKEWGIYKWIYRKENQLPDKDNILILAAQNYRTDMLLEALGSAVIDVNMKDKYGTPLAHILAKNNLSSVITKVASVEGFDINARNSDNETALMIAAKNGNLDAVNALLDAGANAKLTNFAGKSARALAKAAKHKDIAKILKKAEKKK
ncbi:MAG: trypsin-like peptidase domain-containing protein [Bacteroidetes bacterium]|nr:trypsin-like peptidase domain-containing protein [Bacteroidota bacterium]